jgi:hypothetical protein
LHRSQQKCQADVITKRSNRGWEESLSFEVSVEVLTKFPKASSMRPLIWRFALGRSKQSDQMVQYCAAAHGSGKTVRMLVFAKGSPGADATKAAGAVCWV